MYPSIVYKPYHHRLCQWIAFQHGLFGKWCSTRSSKYFIALKNACLDGHLFQALCQWTGKLYSKYFNGKWSLPWSRQVWSIPRASLGVWCLTRYIVAGSLLKKKDVKRVLYTYLRIFESYVHCFHPATVQHWFHVFFAECLPFSIGRGHGSVFSYVLSIFITTVH